VKLIETMKASELNSSNSVEKQKETLIELEASKNVKAFYEVLQQDKEVKYIELGHNFIKYSKDNLTAHITFKIKRND
jgi:hypothetical protein